MTGMSGGGGFGGMDSMGSMGNMGGAFGGRDMAAGGRMGGEWELQHVSLCSCNS